jgi:hypothetical protein
MIPFIFGCSKDSLILDKNGDNNKKVVRFSLKPITIGDAQTKAGTAVNESTVKNLWILQFDGTSGDSKLVKSIYFPDITDLNNIVVQLLAGVDQRVEFIANTFNSSLFDHTNSPLNAFTYTGFLSRKKQYYSESDLFTGVTLKYLLLNGCYIGEIPNKTAAVSLLHNCAKVTLNYTSEDVSAFENGVRFKITSVQMKNVPEESSYKAINLNTTLTNPLSLINYSQITGTDAGTGIGEGYTIGDYIGFVTFYMPENIAGVNPLATSQDLKLQYAPLSATYLEIKGEGIGNDGRLNEFVTFRLYLGNNNTDNYNVNINTHYNINLTFRGVNIADSRIEVLRVTDIDGWTGGEW